MKAPNLTVWILLGISPVFLGSGAKLYIYQNDFSRCLTMLAFGGAEATRDTIYFYRNIVDLRSPVPTGRPTPKNPAPAFDSGHVTGDHGSPPWPSMFTYHNTFIIRTHARAADAWLSGGATADRPRRVFNNILVHLTTLPPHQFNDSPHLEVDGNLYWQPDLAADQTASFFKKYRSSAAFENSKKGVPARLRRSGDRRGPQVRQSRRRRAQ